MKTYTIQVLSNNCLLTYEIRGNSPEQAIEFITDYSVNSGNRTVSEWKDLYKFLFTKYMDGNIKEKDINVENIQSIEIENDSFIEIELFNRSYWLLTDEEGERRARTYLEDDDELWKMAVESGNTTSGFDDWIEDVLNMDGWESVLNGYNGMSNGLFGDWYYMRMN